MVNGSVVPVLISDVGVEHPYGELAERVWKPGSLHGVPWRARVETWQLTWSPIDSTGGNLAASMESHGLRSLDAGLVDVTTAGNGCSGMQRLSVSRQLATDAVVCVVYRCLDSWWWIQWNALDSRSSEVSVLVSGRLRRLG